MNENFRREPIFAEKSREFFGDELFDSIIQNNPLDFSTLERSQQQKFVMVIVPKLISKLVHNDGWKVKTEQNLRYEDGRDKAPMVTWIVKFSWDQNAAAVPDTVYRAALRDIFSRVGVIHPTGEIEQYTFVQQT